MPDLFTSHPRRHHDTNTWMRPLADADPQVAARLPLLAWRGRLLQIYVWAAIIGLVPAVAAAGYFAYQAANPPATTATDPYAGWRRSLAVTALAAWLDKDPAPLPGGVLIGWESSMPVEFIPILKSGRQVNKPPSWTSTREVFDVVDGRGWWWRVSVQTLCDQTCQVVGDPSPTPVAQPGRAGAGGAWPGLDKGVSPSPAVQATVQVWAEAWLGSDAGRLALAVGDTDPAHLYTPLGGGAAAVAAAVGATAAAPNLEGGLVAYVTLGVTWAGQDKAGPAWGVDVLVAQASTPAARVVAWGPPGSGGGLVPYQNAASTPGVLPPPMPTPTPSATR